MKLRPSVVTISDEVGTGTVLVPQKVPEPVWECIMLLYLFSGCKGYGAVYVDSTPPVDSALLNGVDLTELEYSAYELGQCSTHTTWCTSTLLVCRYNVCVCV